MLLFYDVNDEDSLKQCIEKWYPFVKENLDPEITKVLFVGNKIDLLNLKINSKLYKPGTNNNLEKFDNVLGKLRESEKGSEYENWIDWTYTVSTDIQSVQNTVKRVIKRYLI